MRWKTAAVSALLALAMLAPGASAIKGPQVFSLLDVEETFTPLGDFGAFENDAPKPGEGFYLTDGLYRWAGAKKGPRAGTLKAICTFVNPEPPNSLAFCTGSFYLGSGQILAEGFITFEDSGPSTFTLPVIGGTGAYANVRGFVKFRDLGNGNTGRSNVELHLLP
jgi:hypothetical protein